MNGNKIKKYIKILACASLIFNFQFSIFNSAQGQVKWHTIEEADKTKIDGKLYFIDFYTDWCGYCKKMDRETFTDATVAKILNKYYYPVKFNAESGKLVTWQGRQFQPAKGGRAKVHPFAVTMLGQRMGFPTFGLFKPDGTLLQAIPGYYPPKEFVVILWYFASGDCNKYSYEHYTKIFDKEIRPTMDKALKL